MIITTKLNKGGSAKSWTSVQLAHGLALYEKKVLLLTSDSQNNHLNFLGFKGKVTTGLKAAVSGKDHEIYRMRENLEVIALEDNFLSKIFYTKLKSYFEKIKDKYDYVIIDSIPTRNVDDEFVKLSDKIIVPTYCDRVTIEGALEVIESVARNKVLAIIPSRFQNSKVQNGYYNLLKETLEGKDVLFTDPVKQKSFIEDLQEKGKTIWETKSKQIEDVQEIFIEVLGVVLNG